MIIHFLNVEISFQKRKNIAKDRKVIPDPIDDRKFHPESVATEARA
tara:strand:- start:88 stop:225 length:138 start_codon:yes stop_codon:yes gene_type:complete